MLTKTAVPCGSRLFLQGAPSGLVGIGPNRKSEAARGSPREGNGGMSSTAAQSLNSAARNKVCVAGSAAGIVHSLEISPPPKQTEVVSGNVKVVVGAEKELPLCVVA